MSAPRGKGIYARDPDYYPDRDPSQYAYNMGCQFVALHDSASSDDDLRRAQALGLKVYLWEGPDSWLPENWQETLYSHSERVARFDLEGFIADVERQNVWRNHEAEIFELAGTLGSAASAYRSVGFTSFPSWKWTDDVAAIAGPKLWGSPQLYGILEPASPARLLERGAKWHEIFTEVLPSLAAWRRTPAEQAEYLEAFRNERGGIFWQAPTHGGQIQPWPGTAGFDVLRDWNVNIPISQKTFISVLGERILHPTRLRRT